MNDLNKVDTKIRITSIGAHFKHPRATYELTAGSQKPVKPPIDPNLVLVGFNVLENNHLSDAGSVFFMKAKHAKKLRLMVGDVLKLTMVKEKSQGFKSSQKTK